MVEAMESLEVALLDLVGVDDISEWEDEPEYTLIVAARKVVSEYFYNGQEIGITDPAARSI